MRREKEVGDGEAVRMHGAFKNSRSSFFAW